MSCPVLSWTYLTFHLLHHISLYNLRMSLHTCIFKHTLRKPGILDKCIHMQQNEKPPPIQIICYQKCRFVLHINKDDITEYSIYQKFHTIWKLMQDTKLSYSVIWYKFCVKGSKLFKQYTCFNFDNQNKRLLKDYFSCYHVRRDLNLFCMTVFSIQKLKFH